MLCMENETGVIILLACNRKRSFRKTGVVLKRTVFWGFLVFLFFFFFGFFSVFCFQGVGAAFSLLSSSIPSSLPLLSSLLSFSLYGGPPTNSTM